MKRKYYPNNWEAIRGCPASYFPEMPYEDFEDWKIYGYVLPSSHFGIVRIEDLDKGTIEEFTYKTEYHTKQRLKKEMKGNKKVTIATMDGVYHLMPPPIDFNTNP